MPPLSPLPSARRAAGVSLEQRVLGLGVERGGRLVEHQHQRVVAHEAAGERELLPLPEPHLDAVVPGRPELGVEPVREPIDHVVGTGPVDRDRHRRTLVDPRLVAQADGRLRVELEAEEVLERAGELFAPLCADPARSTPSTRIAPAVGVYIRHSSLTSVVLPAPFSPTIATTAPAGSSRFTSSSTSRSVPGYANDTWSNRTLRSMRSGAAARRPRRARRRSPRATRAAATSRARCRAGSRARRPPPRRTATAGCRRRARAARRPPGVETARHEHDRAHVGGAEHRPRPACAQRGRGNAPRRSARTTRSQLAALLDERRTEPLTRTSLPAGAVVPSTNRCRARRSCGATRSSTSRSTPAAMSR